MHAERFDFHAVAHRLQSFSHLLYSQLFAFASGESFATGFDDGSDFLHHIVCVFTAFVSEFL